MKLTLKFQELYFLKRITFEHTIFTLNLNSLTTYKNTGKPKTVKSRLSFNLYFMSGHLWKVTATRNNGKVLKGMSVEIYKKGTTGKPEQKEIAEALSEKYNEDFHYSQCGQSNFDFDDMS